MKAKFYNYQTDDGNRGDIFETEIEFIPLINYGVSFPYNNRIYYSEIKAIEYCFDLDGKFTHIDIELDEF